MESAATTVRTNRVRMAGPEKYMGGCGIVAYLGVGMRDKPGKNFKICLVVIRVR